MNNFPIRKRDDPKKIQIIDVSTITSDDVDFQHAERGIKKRKVKMDADISLAHANKLSYGFNTETYKRVAAAEAQRERLESGDLSSIQDDIKDFAFSHLDKKTKRKLKREKLAESGAVLQKQRGNWKVMESQRKQKFEKEVSKYKEERSMGLTGLEDPYKRLKREKAMKTEHRETVDPFSKALKLHSVGKVRKDGMLTFNKRDVARVHSTGKEKQLKLRRVFN